VNIANFSLGRNEGGKPAKAVAVVHVDGVVPEKVLASLRKLPAVRYARAVDVG
jgi:hypothetical protein